MAEVKWIKLMVDVFNNHKIKQIEATPEGDAIIVIWFYILCLAGSINDDGMVYFTPEIPYTEDMLATEFRRPLNTVKLALTVFKRFGMIEIINDVIHVSNWQKYQNVDRMQEIREYNRIAQQKSRDRRRITAPVNDVSMTSQHSHATELDIDIDREVDRERVRADKPPPAKRFKAPTAEEVDLYCKERNNFVNADKFINHYESNGWKVGRNSMKDWKAAVRKWENSDFDNQSQAKANTVNKVYESDANGWGG